MKTLKVTFVSICAVVMFFGLLSTPVILDWGWQRVVAKVDNLYDKLLVRKVPVEKVVTVEKEPEYCEGVCGLLTKHARAQGVPVAVGKAVAMQEGAQKFHNLQVNCNNRYWAKEHNLKNCALGMMQLIPVFNGIEDPLSILGEENIERNIELGMKRLKEDFNSSKGINAQARWYQAFVKYYGADQDGYPTKVMALVAKFAIEEG